MNLRSADASARGKPRGKQLKPWMCLNAEPVWWWDSQERPSDTINDRLIILKPGSPWENGYLGTFYGKMRDELLNGEIFYSLKEARIIIEMWRKEYNTIRPHSALGYQPPMPEAILVPSTQFYQLALP